MQRDLFLTANLQGGYDDNVGASPGASASAGTAVPASGSAGVGDVMLEYSRGTAERRINVRSLGSLQFYPGYLEKPATTGKVRLMGHTVLGRANVLRFSTQVRYEPLFTPGVIEDAEGVSAGVLPPDSATAVPSAPSGAGSVSAALFERRSWVSSNKAYLDRDWNRRDKTVAAYLFFLQRYVGGGGENAYHQGGVEQRHRFGRNATLFGGYRFTAGHQTDATAIRRPNSQHTLDAGLSLDRRTSRERSVSLRIGGGVTRVGSVNTVTGAPFQGWAPTASAAGTVDLTANWWMSGGYVRGFSMLQGLTGEFFATDTVGGSAGGRFGKRTVFALGGRVSNGRTLREAGASDSFHLYGTTVGVRIALTSALAATANYAYSRQTFSRPEVLPPGFPPRYGRHAVTAGLTFWVPLAGASPARPRAVGEW